MIKNISFEIKNNLVEQNISNIENITNDFILDNNNNEFINNNDFDDIKKDSNDEIKNLMMFVKNNNNNNNNNNQSKINDLEIENQILKIEIKELKEKMQMFEIFMLNFQTSNSFSFDNNLNNYDKLMTKIKNIEYDVKKIKEDLEYVEGLSSQNSDKIELLEHSILPE